VSDERNAPSHLLSYHPVMEENPYKAPTSSGAKIRRRRLQAIARANVIFFFCVVATLLILVVVWALHLTWS
jgi:hypothetical protein